MSPSWAISRKDKNAIAPFAGLACRIPTSADASGFSYVGWYEKTISAEMAVQPASSPKLIATSMLVCGVLMTRVPVSSQMCRSPPDFEDQCPKDLLVIFFVGESPRGDPRDAVMIGMQVQERK
jgi:hypothetical protein